MLDTFRQLKITFGKRQWKFFWILMAALFIEAVFECVGIGLVLPAVSVLLDPNFITSNEIGIWLSHFLHIHDADTFLSVIIIGIVGLYVVKNLYLLVVSYCQHRFILTCQYSLKEKLLEGIFHAPYARHMDQTTPELVQIVETDADGSVILLETAMRTVSEMLLIGSMSALMVGVNWKVALIVVILYGGLLLLFNRIVKPYFEKKSRQYIDTRRNFNKWLYQTVGNIKEIKAERKEYLFMKNFSYYAQRASRIDTKVKFIQTIPKSVFEVCCIISLLFIIKIFMSGGMSVEQMVAQMSVFVLIVVRLMPCALRLNQHFSKLYINRALLARTASRVKEYEEWAGCHEKIEPMMFREKLELEHISFSYPGGEKTIFEDADMEICAGEMIGIGGLSGIGKTTLVDIIIGLLPVTAGKMKVDGRVISNNKDAMAAWCAAVAYIPQNVLLLNGTIRDNVLFGSEDRGDDAIWDALERAAIADYVRGLPEGLNTFVGESGNRMSGGQRQRMAFARALYQKAQFLILDETTSALDTKSEEAVLDVIKSIKGTCTIVMISHRQSALDYCDKVYTILDKKIREVL